MEEGNDSECPSVCLALFPMEEEEEEEEEEKYIWILGKIVNVHLISAR